MKTAPKKEKLKEKGDDAAANVPHKINKEAKKKALFLTEGYILMKIKR